MIGRRAPALLAACVAAALASCHAGVDDGEFPRAQTLYLGGRQWGEPASFNPLSAQAGFPVGMDPTGLNFVYEYLLLYNTLTGKLEPALASSYRVGQDSIEIELDPAARWNDGQPVTAEDVQFTFELGHTYPSLAVSTLWQHLSGVRILDPEAGQAPGASAAHPRRVAFLLDPKRRNPLVVLDGLATVRIVPKHVIAPLLESVHGDLEAFDKLKFDSGTVASGPYRLRSFSSEKIVLERDDRYWGNAARHQGQLPAPKFIIHPIFKSNDHFSVALQQGRLDMSVTFIPRIWLKERKGVRAWYDKPPYFPPASIPMLYLNVGHGALGDVHLRRAMAFAINYDDIRELAVSGYSDPLQPGLILPFGVEEPYFSAEDAKAFGTRFDPDKARAELKAGGYSSTFNDQGELVSMQDGRGQRLPTLYIKSPTGWSDWEAMVRIAVKSMRAVGIDVRERFVDTTLFYPSWLNGDFDLLLNTPSPSPAPSKPWSRFEALLSTRDWAPEGQKMYVNQGRFNDPTRPGYIARIDELLDLIPNLEPGPALVQAYRELNRLAMEQQPVLPLVYRPDQFYEFSERVWRGFPTAANPYLPSQMPGDGPGTLMLWTLKPAVAQ